ncbi:MAG: DegV family EDD domain-containing protein [Actinobacteria bacterium]|nr:DegV family EDD domain-containing protein [Actinomycetota bacterium]
MIQIVTDSGSQLTAELRERLDVSVVPVTVVVDGEAFREGESIDLVGITDALRRGAQVSTSTPSPGDFIDVYRRCEQVGATEILSIHTGGSLSSTAQTARLAAAAAPIPVTVIDTGTASFPVALCLWAASDALRAGGSVEEAAAAVTETAAELDSVFTIGTLDLAKRGGRVSPAIPDAGIPVIAFVSGEMNLVGNVHDGDSSIEAMASYVDNQTAGRRLRVGVGHIAAPQLADELEQALRDRLTIEQLVRYDVGPSVAVHTGLGTVGCVFHPIN